MISVLVCLLEHAYCQHLDEWPQQSTSTYNTRILLLQTQTFKILQVISACAMSFAHGANDVANAIGSFAAAYYVYSNAKVPGSNTSIYPWILAIGGTGIVVGLATYGK